MIERVHVKHDHEWVNLMREAKELGLSVEEVRQFLQKEREEVIKQGDVQKD
ncbi:anti-repressor SinI family protein [Lentibacillus sp. CBA3610]|uniref:anti-repressor SinI family protein n=1 Tax=Lentibacillus sp. CBA3610 TaxID=2518176 RepID=UPI00159566CC|nr:anti-repressor SinI family protein [Lentibacillus sp. CBA3610]QKY68657.1 DNA-binding anti-repressor SinI [Lentibacillus sp. CBA3610]